MTEKNNPQNTMKKQTSNTARIIPAYRGSEMPVAIRFTTSTPPAAGRGWTLIEGDEETPEPAKP
jgi:hypothetical protein